MALREHFEASGAWLFRWRSYLPLVLFVFVFLGLRHYHYPNGSHAQQTAWEIFCLLIGLAGEAVRAAAIGYVAMGTSSRVARAQEADALNTTGLYSLVRHPLYLGNYLMWLGPALLTRNVWVPLVVSLAFWLYYERIMAAEEAFLRSRFGEVFERWANATPAFLPALHGWQAPATKFQLRRVLRRERSSILGLMATFTVLTSYIDSRIMGRLHVDPLWFALFALTLIFYGVMEADKRRRRQASKTAPAASSAAGASPDSVSAQGPHGGQGGHSHSGPVHPAS